MRTGSQKNDEIALFKGEYLSLMASSEYHLTLVITEYLGIIRHSQEFQDWLVSVPIPFSCKIDLFESLIKEDTQLDQFRGLLRSLRSLWGFRNILAHSFDTHFGTRTSRGKEVPANQVTLKALKSRIGELRKVEDTLSYMLVCAEVGTPPPESVDDFSDGPI